MYCSNHINLPVLIQSIMLKRFIDVERMLCSSIMRTQVNNNSFIRLMSSKSTVALKISKKADLNSELVKVKKNIMIRHLTTIKGPGEFLYHLRYKGRKVSRSSTIA